MHTVVCSVTRGDSGRHAMTLRMTIWQRSGERCEDRRSEEVEMRYREGVKRGGKERPRGEERTDKRRREVERCR